MKLEQGKIVKWENSSKQEIIWMICNDTTKGVVIHSDNLLRIGTITDNIEIYDLEPFTGTVNIAST